MFIYGGLWGRWAPLTCLMRPSDQEPLRATGAEFYMGRDLLYICHGGGGSVLSYSICWGEGALTELQVWSFIFVKLLSSVGFFLVLLLLFSLFFFILIIYSSLKCWFCSTLITHTFKCLKNSYTFFELYYLKGNSILFTPLHVFESDCLYSV